MNTKPVDHQAIADAFDSEEQERPSGQRTVYLKLDANSTQVRLLPSNNPESPLPYRLLRSHRMKNRSDRWRNPLYGKFLINNEVVLQAALEAQLITDTDVDMYSAFEDPFVKIAIEGKAAGLNKKLYSKGWADTRFIFNAFRRDDPSTVGVLTISKTMRDQINVVRKAYPEMFDPDVGYDIMIAGNGEAGKARRYLGVMAAREPSPVGMEWESKLTDLDNHLVYKAMPYIEKVWGAFDKFGSVVATLGLTAVDFGIDPEALAALAAEDDEEDDD
jgi:hypothetical protein